MSYMSTVWEDTYGCDKQYRCALVIYLITMLSSSMVLKLIVKYIKLIMEIIMLMESIQRTNII